MGGEQYGTAIIGGEKVTSLHFIIHQIKVNGFSEMFAVGQETSLKRN